MEVDTAPVLSVYSPRLLVPQKFRLEDWLVLRDARVGISEKPQFLSKGAQTKVDLHLIEDFGGLPIQQLEVVWK